MLLAIDVGNSETLLGLYREEKLVAWWRIATAPQRTADEYAALFSSLFQSKGLSAQVVRGVVVACVVPPILPTLKSLADNLFGVVPLVVGPGVKTGMRILTDDPREVGPDRIACAVAARKFYGTPAIVVDFGTALVFDAISAQGDYLGNAIAPGLSVSAEALFHQASRLPRVELSIPPSVIGKNTVASMQAGTMYGYISLVEGMLERLMKEVGSEAHIIATGTWADKLAPRIPLIQKVDPFLSLKGLRLIYLLNTLHPSST